MATGVAAAWLTEDVRVLGLVTLPAAMAAALLVMYFGWRAKLQHRILVERDDRHDLDKAA
jgi:hypothetical protein